MISKVKNAKHIPSMNVATKIVQTRFACLGVNALTTPMRLPMKYSNARQIAITIKGRIVRPMGLLETAIKTTATTGTAIMEI